jgi:hypothetical protein
MKTLLTAAAMVIFGAQAPTSRVQPGDGIIQVTVRDSATREPIQGARVTFTLSKPNIAPVVTDLNSDETGRIALRDPSFGIYWVDAQKDRYVWLSSLGAKRVVIDETTRKHDVEFLLDRSVTIRGRVVNPDGAPVPNEDVYPMQISYRQGRRTLVRVGSQASGVTDDRGDYSISNLPAGDYFVRVELRGSNPGRLARTSYYPGFVDVLSAPSVPLTAGAEAIGIDIRIPAVRTYRISGRVVNTLPMESQGGRPVPRSFSSIEVQPADPDALEEAVRVSSRVIATEKPDEFGFEIVGMLPGNYYVYPLLQAPAGTLPSSRSTRLRVTIKDEDIENLRITLEPNPELKGRVVVDGDASVIDWQKAQFHALPIDRLPTSLRGNGVWWNIDPRTHEFVFSAYQKGVKFGLRVAAGFPPDSYVADLRQGSRSLNFDGAIEPSEGPVEIILGLRGGVLQGTVLNSSGQPQVRSSVALVPSAPRRANPSLYNVVGTDTAGKFTIRGIAPGEYKVFAWLTSPGPQAEQNAEFIAQYETRGTAVNIQAGSTRTVQLTALPLR